MSKTNNLWYLGTLKKHYKASGRWFHVSSIKKYLRRYFHKGSEREKKVALCHKSSVIGGPNLDVVVSQNVDAEGVRGQKGGKRGQKGGKRGANTDR